jgi:hypothetical protein
MIRSTSTGRKAAVGRLAVASAIAVTATVAGVSAAGAAGSTHTMRFVGKQIQDVQVHDTDVATDTNTHKGKTLGYDVTSCVINLETHVGNCTVAVARAEGILYARATVNLDTGKGTGKVTGGSGAFRGASGTADIEPGSSPDSNTITITYQV